MSNNPNITNPTLPLCGNCKFFVVGGLCELVHGQINSKAICDLHQFGNPQPINIPVNPKYKKSDVNYKPGFFVETTAINENIIQKALQMEHQLLSRGIPEEEVHRAVIAYFSEPEPPIALPWPGPVTGYDLAGRIDPVIVPDTGMPLTDFTGLPDDVQPYPTPNKSPYGIGSSSEPYQSFLTPDPNSIGSTSNVYNITNSPYRGDSTNWTGLASDVNSEPSMHNEHGYNVATTIPLFPDNYEALHSDSRIHSKGIEPSGAVSTTTTECSCKNKLQIPSIHLDLPIKKISRKSLQESISNLRSEFEWLGDDYIMSARELAQDAGGTLYLIRAARETITDHRSESEKFRRKLSADELRAMTRTAIGKSMDINHQPELEVDATILDAEFDENRKEIQMLVIVKDHQINEAINNGKISAVSINGGMPRSESVEPCDDNCTDNNCELCLVPKGVVLGELDGVGMTFVVTDPNGLYWNSHFVPHAEPGIKVTLIEKLV